MQVSGFTNHQSATNNGVCKATVSFNKRGQVVLGIDTPDKVGIRREAACPQIQEIEALQNISI